MSRAFYMVQMLERELGDRPISGAEIGVFRGEHALLMLEHLNIKKLYLIDPYETDDPSFVGKMKVKGLIAGAYAIAEEALSDYSDKTVWMLMPSDEAVKIIFNDASLHFVYIDGNHNYEHTKCDIKNYLSLVRPGGFLGGHDYMMRSSPLIEVKRAVDEFIEATGYELNVSPGKFPEWWVQV